MAEKVRRLGARELLDTVLDEGSWASWDSAPAQPAPEGSPYAAELAAARDRSGCDEAIITGEGRIRGRRVAIIAGEFRFLAGSIGAVAAERIVVAFERARREQLPMFAAPASGGTRMQEGTPAFVGMVKISAACAQFKAAGLPYLVYLRHPTTGGVFASWGSLGQVTVAEPGAMIGFLGARVYEALYGRAFPEGVQTAENLFEHGLIDAILPVEALAGTADRALNVLMGAREEPPGRGRRAEGASAGPPGMGLHRTVPPDRSTRRARPAQARRDGRAAAPRDRVRRVRPRAAHGVGAVRRSAVHRARAGPAGPDAGRAVVPQGASGGAAWDGAGARARPPSGQHHRHRRCRAVEGGRGGWHGRGDRPMPRRARHPPGAHAVRPARAGHGRWGAGPDAGRPRHLRTALVALAAAPRGRLGDPAPGHDTRARARRGPASQVAGPARRWHRRPHRRRAPRCGRGACASSASG